MAQDPEPDEEQQDEGLIDPSHELDMVPVFESSTVDAEIEADVIAGLLEANGIPSYLDAAYGRALPWLSVAGSASRMEEAQRVIQEAQVAGPEAAAEAEAASEEGL